MGDVYGHFATPRHALAELGFGPGDRLFSIGDLVDRGPDSFQALSWMEGSALPARGEPAPASEPGEQAPARFDLVIRGNHEQLMLDALASEASPDYEPLWPTGRDLWYDNGCCWWRNRERRPKPPAEVWTAALAALPFAAHIETPHGPVGLVHACPALPSWEELEAALAGDGPDTAPDAQAGVRAVVTGHTPVKKPLWQANVLDIDTGIARAGLRRLTIARIDSAEIGTWTFNRVPEDRA